jgi:acetate kinase
MENHRPVASSSLTDHKSAANSLIDWLEKQIDFKSVKGVGHRVVHGMKHTEPEMVTKKLVDELRRISPNDPDHLPREIELIETFRRAASETAASSLLRHGVSPNHAARGQAAADSPTFRSPREFSAMVSTDYLTPI